MTQRLVRSLGLAALLLPALAHAHPGHAGPRVFEWDFGHVADHPVATVAGLGLVAAVGLTAWVLSRNRRAAASRVRRDRS